MEADAELKLDIEYITPTRFAVVLPTSRKASHPARLLEEVQAYLPANFRAKLVAGAETFQPPRVLIYGNDRAGWTMDGYVIPRLASGMLVARELEVG